MDETLRHHNPNPLLTSNPLSKLFFWWMNPTFITGYKRRLEIEDLYNVTEDDSSEYLGDRLETEWKKELKKADSGGKPSLICALTRIFGLQYMLLGIVVFVEEGTKVVQPLLLGQLIRYFTTGSSVTKESAYLHAMGVSLCAVILTVTHHPYFFAVQRIGMRMRVACCSLLYRKALRLSNTALGQTTTGQIVNLMSNDVNRFDTAAIFLHYLWVGPCQAIPVLIILWGELGPSTLAGFAVLLLLVPVQSWMGKLFSKLRHKTALHTDERVKVMNEIISGMRVIKMYCWEKPFGDLVGKLRRLEGKRVKTSGYIRGLIVGPFFVSAKLIVFLTFLSYILSGGGLTADKVFVTIGIYQAIRLSTTLFIPFAVQFASETTVTCRRVQKFLLLDELDKTESSEQSSLQPKKKDCKVNIQNITAKWDQNLEQDTLQKISVEVGPGKLLAVIGPVGAGKSSLLMSILKELPVSSGNIEVKGRLSYVAQQPWVFSATFRQNIIFGNKYEKKKYDRILKACALHKDVDAMPDGDFTMIGDRGVSLSGGQRARVSLARALYMDADIYLLDDPLSAVDTAVGRHLFENVVQGILKDKPRILVTHQLQFLAEADEVLILKEGACLGQGTFEEMANSGIDFSSLLKTSEDEEKEEENPKDLLQRLESVCHSHGSKVDIGSTFSLTSIGTEFEADPVVQQPEEERKEGTVGFRIYFEYFKAGAGIFKFLILLILNLAAQTFYVLSDWWLAYWSNLEEERAVKIEEDAALRAVLGLNMTSNETIVTNITIPYVDTNEHIYIFTGLIIVVFLFGLLRALMFFKVAVDASMSLHNRMFNRLLRTPISFFDTNPVGRILNRFSKDTGHMDDVLPITLFDFIQCFLLIVGIVLVVCVVNPWVFLPLIPLCILFFVTRRYYIQTSRHIKRLEGTTRSPVFSHLSASLQGLHTIRAFSVQGKFTEEFDNHQNLHSEAWFMFLTSSRWLAVRLDWICAIFVTVVAFSCVLVKDNLGAGEVGLSLTYAMSLMGMFQWAVRQSAEVENQMISVERVLDYTQLETEADLDSDKDHKPPPDWPQHGKITTNNTRLRYSPTGPFVLKGLKFTIQGQEKIGIVGRTGAGKSSLITMLFRMVEPTGNVSIDDVDILKIGLHDLRSKISIIPQDPVLFTGSLRKNLDPFNNHEDTSLWRALEEVQMKSAIDDLPQGLESEISEGGINFSVGQRQLICLARAILRKNKILMIDEATANVDPRTDQLIQETIREKFKNCTVLTIAHRLNTIMDSDKVLVMDDGNIMEFDQPYSLLKDENGHFYKMVQQTGKAETDHLMEVAKKSYKADSPIPEEEENLETSSSHDNDMAEHDDDGVNNSVSNNRDTEVTNSNQNMDESENFSQSAENFDIGEALSKIPLIQQENSCVVDGSTSNQSNSHYKDDINMTDASKEGGNSTTSKSSTKEDDKELDLNNEGNKTPCIENEILASSSSSSSSDDEENEESSLIPKVSSEDSKVDSVVG